MHRWFATSSQPLPGPAELHAKEMGTHTSVCGQDASSWIKWWDTPLPVGKPQAFPRCADRAGIGG